mgnify:CR=1 FL=1
MCYNTRGRAPNALPWAADLLPGYPYIRKGTEPYGKRKNRALAHKAKTSGLTEAELAERDALRQEYLADIRASMIDQLEHTTVIEPDGTRRKLQVRH